MYRLTVTWDEISEEDAFGQAHSVRNSLSGYPYDRIVIEVTPDD